MTPAALYERQRALARAGILFSEGNRGPGSGVRTTTGSVSCLLLGAVVAETLGSVADQVRVLTELRVEGAQCALTGHKKLLDVMCQMLVSEAASRDMSELSVSKNSARAVLTFKKKGVVQQSIFTDGSSEPPAIRTDVVISSKVIVPLALDVRAAILAKSEESDEE